MKIVIVGLGTGGFTALMAIKRTSEAEVTVIDEKGYLLHVCGLPYGLDGRYDLDILKHEMNPKMMNFNLVKAKAESIDSKKKVVIADGKEYAYDKLVLAPGASPFVPPIPGAEKALTVHKVEDTQKVMERSNNSKSAVVVGAGAVGLEAASVLKEKGLDVTIVELSDNVMGNSFDPEMSELIKQHCENAGIKLLLGTKVTSITDNVVETDKDNVQADLVIMATGIRPNLELPESAGLKMDKLVNVNDKMQSSDPDIYVVGDAVETFSMITKKPTHIWLATPAFRQGTIAGTNAAGGEASYKGGIGSFSTTVGKLEIAASGLTEQAAKDAGFDTASSKLKTKHIPPYFPGAEDVTLKLVADKKTRTLVGCQAIGKDASKKVDVLSLAIQQKIKVDDLDDLELTYCPPLSDIPDIILKTVDMLLRRIS